MTQPTFNAGTRAPSNTQHALRILVVDDSPKLRRLIALILRQDGYVVDTVGTASEGVAHLQRERYALVISDLSSDGTLAALRLAQAGRRVWPNLCFVLATGSQDDDLTNTEQSDWGVDALLRKPFTPAQLREVVGRLDVSQ